MATFLVLWDCTIRGRRASGWTRKLLFFNRSPNNWRLDTSTLVFLLINNAKPKQLEPFLKSQTRSTHTLTLARLRHWCSNVLLQWCMRTMAHWESWTQAAAVLRSPHSPLPHTRKPKTFAG